MKTIGGSLPRRFKATASGAITAGKPCIVEADGDVAQIVETEVPTSVGTPGLFESDVANFPSVTYDSTAQKVVIAYRDTVNSFQGTATVGTVSGTSISFGTPAIFNAGNTGETSSTYDANAQKVVIAYRDFANSGYGTAVVGTVSGTSISFGTPVVFESATTTDISPVYDANAQKIVIAYTDNGVSPAYGTAIVGTVSGTSISFGTAVVFESATTTFISATYDSNAQKVVIGYRDEGNLNQGTAIVGTVSGTSISFGTPVLFESDTTDYVSAAYDSSAQKIVIAYRDAGNSFYGTAIVGTVSGTSISFGTAVVFESATITYTSAAYDTNAQKVAIAFRDQGNTNQGTAIVGTVSGTSISFETAVVFETGNTLDIDTVYDANAQKVVIVYRDADNSNKGTYVVLAPTQLVTNLTTENYIGIAEYAAADTETATVLVKGGVSTPGGTALDPPTAGTAVEFEDGGTGTFQAIVYDPDSNKVVIAYTDAGDSNKGKAVVGTVSGASISFGTPVEFEAGGTSYIVATYDTNSDKVVIAYQDAGNSLYGTAIVGTVSGTSISFGTAVVYNAGEVTYQGIAFDSSNNKVVICYRDNANTNYATAIVGTVSGTSISFGTEVVYNSANSLYNVATFDSTNSKVVIAYRDGGNSNYGTAIVGTVSGTSISFGSEAVFSGTSSTQWMGATFDSTNGKVVLAYRNDGSTQTDAVVGTVSGTSISFGTPVLVLDGSNTYHALSFDSVRGEVGLAFREATTNDLEFFVGTVSGTSISFGTALEVAGNVEYSPVAYDSSAQKFVVSYHDNDDSSKGKAAVVSTTFSMTPGQTYFVQGDGTLGLTADSPSVTAGTAVTSLKLIVKG